MACSLKIFTRKADRNLKSLACQKTYFMKFGRLSTHLSSGRPDAKFDSKQSLLMLKTSGKY